MITLIANKPFIGYLGIGVGFTSGLLTIVKVLTPILGFGGALFGFVAGGITLWLKIKELRKAEKDE